ncbi:hypothetical protein ScPMuIL_005734 [Solemya velum]
MSLKRFGYFGKARFALKYLQRKNPFYITGTQNHYTGELPLAKHAEKEEILFDENNSAKKTKLPVPVSNGDGHPSIDLSFQNCREAYKSKDTKEVLRAYCVLSLCSVNTLVNNNKRILKWSKKILGKRLFKKMMRSTFYGHFVAGEDIEEIRPVITKNRMFGVKSILDYSVEKDISTEEATEAEMRGCVTSDGKHHVSHLQLPNRRFLAYRQFADRRENVVSARTYFYEDENQCDENMHTILKSIDSVSACTDGSGFAAVKLTALGRPQLLLQMSAALVSIRNFFDRFAGTEGDMSRRKFREEDFARRLGDMGVSLSPDDTRKWFSILDITDDGEVDLLDWDNLLEVNMNLSKLFVVPNIATGELDPLVTGLSESEEEQMKNMLHRVNMVVEYAAQSGVRIMVDAEQTYFQPAISRLTMEMMRKFNTNRAVVFNTYQCYLKQAYANMMIDMDLAKREDFFFGAKIVRGAYMEQERERARAISYPDPINPTFESTTQMYHGVLEEVLRQINAREKGKIAVMVATHNEDTIRFTVEKMKQHGVMPDDRVICFGQLYGMCDQVSFPLGQAGYSVYKYVPYGPVDEVLPYLSRRAKENGSMLKKVKKEKRLLWSELKRRISTGQFLYDPLKVLPPS